MLRKTIFFLIFPDQPVHKWCDIPVTHWQHLPQRAQFSTFLVASKPYQGQSNVPCAIWTITTSCVGCSVGSLCFSWSWPYSPGESAVPSDWPLWHTGCPWCSSPPPHSRALDTWPLCPAVCQSRSLVLSQVPLLSPASPQPGTTRTHTHSISLALNNHWLTLYANVCPYI